MDTTPRSTLRRVLPRRSLTAIAAVTALVGITALGAQAATVSTTVTVTAPTAGATVSGRTTLASDGGRSATFSPTKVSFTIDGTLVGSVKSSTAGSYQLTWDTTMVPNGTHQVVAISYGRGNKTVARSAAVSFTVANLVTPTPQLTAPAAGAGLRGSVTLASDGGRTATFTPTTVTFLADGASVVTGAWDGTRYSASWNSDTVSEGTHQLAVTVTDGTVTGTSPSTSVLVDRTAPTGTPVLTASALAATSVNLAWTASSDNLGVRSYIVSRNGAWLAAVSGSTLAYPVSGLSPQTAYAFTVTAVDAANNTGPVSNTVNLTTPATVTTTTNKARLGIATGSPYVPSGLSEAQYWDKLASLGVGWARFDATPGGTYTPTSYSAGSSKVANAKARGLKAVVSFTYGLNGAKTIPTTATDRQAWANWAANTAAAYEASSTTSGAVGAYEIWNEANNTYFDSTLAANVNSGTAVANYTDLLKRTYAAIKAKGLTAPVLTTGTSPGGGNGSASSTTDYRNPATYLAGIYANGGKGSFDAVAHHPYETWYGQYVNLGGGGYRATHYVRLVMNANGESAKQLWGTEAGWPSCYPYPSTRTPMTEAQRVYRFNGDLNDWFNGRHAASDGHTLSATDTTTATVDWNTGPFMMFKLYKESVDPGLGIIYGPADACTDGTKPPAYWEGGTDPATSLPTAIRAYTAK